MLAGRVQSSRADGERRFSGGLRLGGQLAGEMGNSSYGGGPNGIFSPDVFPLLPLEGLAVSAFVFALILSNGIPKA